ncbi:MAG: ABC transporter ATP-binding protein [Candidatus Roizmanbacteria bacterium]
MKNILAILKLARPLYAIMSILSVFILIGSLLNFATPLLIKFIVDDITQNIAHHSGNFQRISVLIAMMFAANTISTLLTSVTNRMGDHLAGRLRQFLTEKFYHKVFTLPQSYFDGELSGKILNQLNRGISTIYVFINTATNFILPTFIQSIMTIFILAYYNIPIAAFTFLLFPIYFFLSFKSSVAWGKEDRKKNIIEDLIRGRMQETISNIKLVKGFTTEKKEYSLVSDSLTKINKIYARQSLKFHLYDFARNWSLQIIQAIIAVILFIEAFNGRMTIGTMVLVLQLVAQARQPLFAMSFILARVQEAESGSKEYFNILSLPSTENFEAKSEEVTYTNPSITFEHVAFKYDESKSILKNVSFTLEPKQKVALVGHSGAGKSTIVNLILKFYEPTEGVISIDGTPYTNLDHGSIRKNIALVYQDTELFSTTIRENVAYGTKATEKELIEALKKANAYDFVSNLKDKLDSEIGERGIRLSGGQKQRIQIARAILKNAPILILDEATSSLDAKSEKEVQEALENLMEDKLVIIIAHRFSTIQNVNKIIVVDDGKIVDQGNPQELAKKSGIYSDLLNYQIQGNKKLLKEFELG